jgi:hypothetical protein
VQASAPGWPGPACSQRRPTDVSTSGSTEPMRPRQRPGPFAHGRRPGCPRPRSSSSSEPSSGRSSRLGHRRIPCVASRSSRIRTSGRTASRSSAEARPPSRQRCSARALPEENRHVVPSSSSTRQAPSTDGSGVGSRWTGARGWRDGPCVGDGAGRCHRRHRSGRRTRGQAFPDRPRRYGRRTAPAIGTTAPGTAEPRKAMTAVMAVISCSRREIGGRHWTRTSDLLHVKQVL